MLYSFVALLILVIAGIIYFVMRKMVGTTWFRTVIFWFVVGAMTFVIFIYGVNTSYREDVLGGFDTVEQALDYYDYGKGGAITDVVESPTSAFVTYKSDSNAMAIMLFAKKDGKWLREYTPSIEQGDIHYCVELFKIGNTNEWYVYVNCATIDDIVVPEDIVDMYGSKFTVINYRENSKKFIANVWMKQSVYTINIGNRDLEFDLMGG